MIKGFEGRDTEAFYNRTFVRRFSGFERQALKRRRILDSAETLEALRALPSNRLEAASTISGVFVLSGPTVAPSE